jgi:hypothetical protein
LIASAVTVVSNSNLKLINELTPFLDKAAIGLSTVCAIHCLTLPIALAMIPSVVLLEFGDENFHQLLTFVVFPTSLIALTMGCRRHRHWQVLGWGVAGLSLLVLTAMLGHDLMGEKMEKFATLCGAMLVVMSHLMNFRRCRANDCEG